MAPGEESTLDADACPVVVYRDPDLVYEHDLGHKGLSSFSSSPPFRNTAARLSGRSAVILDLNAYGAIAPLLGLSFTWDTTKVQLPAVGEGAPLMAQEVDDVVVVVPGIQGSRLAKAGREVWGFSGSAAWNAITSGGSSIRDLELPRDLGDSAAPDGVMATGLLPTLHGIPGLGPFVGGYSGLASWLQDAVGLTVARGGSSGNLVLFAYDWRLSSRYNATLLKTTAESALRAWRKERKPDAKLTFICHSMGGLVARYYLNVLGGAEWTRTIVTLGTPHRGAGDALVKLVNGVRIGKGPLRFNVSGLARSFPSTYQLLPTYECVEDGEDGPLCRRPPSQGSTRRWCRMRRSFIDRSRPRPWPRRPTLCGWLSEAANLRRPRCGCSRMVGWSRYCPSARRTSWETARCLGSRLSERRQA